ncbi:MAG: tetratricopeptide repeat protein [Firmicutes bacterium]|nr:tetratricopeptide repeat protein [Bacillota bacterium]
MIIKETLERLLTEPVSEELIGKLLELLTQSIEQQDFDGYFLVASQLFDTYVSLQDYDSAIATLKTAINSEYTEDYKVILPMIDKLIGQLIRIEDFHELEALLKMRERFITGDKHQQMMQSFYLSVGLEGLKKYSSAIEVLENIPDNMSSNNIISKYLKLSMLSMQTSNLDKARQYFDKATLFDRFQKNPLFALVESDLYYAEKDYLKALEKYQEYFIKSKIKNRYLDRYLLLCVQLERYDEALKFYHDYEPKIRTTLSKNYQKLFYEAGLSLFEHVYAPSDYEYCRDRLNELRNETIEILNQFDGLYSLISKLLMKQDIHSPREVLLHGSRAFFDLVHVDRFHFIYLQDDGYHVLTYHKKLLMEKIFSYVQIQGSIIEEIFADPLSLHVYHKSDLENMTDFMSPNPISSEMVIASKTYSEVYGNMYIMIGIDQTTHYDYIHKLLMILSRILESQLINFFFERKEEEFSMIREAFEDKLEIGFIRIEHGVVTLLNPIAKRLLGMEEEHFPYERLRDKFINPKPYLDDFLHKDEWVVEMNVSPNKRRFLKILVKEIRFALYLHITDVTDEVNQTALVDHLMKQDIDSSFETIQSLKTRFEQLEKATSLIYFDLDEREELFQKYHFSFKKKLNSFLPSILKKISRTSFIGAYRANESGWFLFLDTVDKRVIGRVWNELTKETNQTDLILEDVTFSGICAINQKKRVFEELIDELYEQFYRHNKISELRYSDRKQVNEQHLLKTIHLNLEQLLSSKEIPVEYHPIGDWTTYEAFGYQIDLHSSVLLGEKKLMEEAIITGGYSLKMDILLIKSFLKSNVSKLKTYYLFKIHHETIKNHSVIDDIVRRIKRVESLNISQCVFVLEFPLKQNFHFHEDVEYLKNKGFLIAFDHLFNLKMNDLNILSMSDFLIVSHDDFLHGKEIQSLYDFKLIYNHTDETLKKSILNKYGIRLVKGMVFPPIDKPVTDLRSIHENIDS